MTILGRCAHCGADVRPEFTTCPFCDAPLRSGPLGPGTVIDGRYRLEERIGAGGMGEVWRATHIHLETPRVVKVVRRDLMSDADAQERFVREARLATRVQHPNVAMLHDFATLPDGRAYMAWELIEGRSLAALFQGEGSLQPQRAVRLAAEALDGLAAIHAAGIIHRDISPDNLMITAGSDGERVKIIDLGIARDDTLEGPAKTQTGMFLGKFKYCSPEHLGFLPPGQRMDGRADIYSMGIVLYEALSGTPPFVETTPHAWILSHTTRPPRSLREVAPHIPWSPELERTLMRALAKNRDERFANAETFADELRALLPGLGWSAASVTERTPLVAGTVKLGPAEEPRPPVTDVVSRPAGDVRRVEAAPAHRREMRTLFAGVLVVIALGAGAVALAVRKDRATSAPVTSPAPVVTTATATAQPVGKQFPITAMTPVVEAPPPGMTVDVSAPVEEKPKPSSVRPVRRPAVTPSNAAKVEAVEEPVTSVAPLEVAPPPPPAQTFAPRAGARRLVADREYANAFARGIIPDYGAMTRGRHVQWLWVAPDVRLRDHAVHIGQFRNTTAVDDPEVNRFLHEVAQDWVNAISNPDGPPLRTEGVIWWAAKQPARPRGIGIEMIFRDAEGRIVAMLRHRIRENTPADAAEEMAEAIQDFVEDGR